MARVDSAALDAPMWTWAAVPPGEPAEAPLACSGAGPPLAPTTEPSPSGGATAPAAQRSSSRVATRTAPIAAFLGDSYSSGFNGAGYGTSGWPAIVGAALRLRPLNRAVPGTGFVNPGWTAQPIRTQVAAVIRADPRIVFVAGGHNDRRYATADTQAAAIAVIERLHRGLPQATLVVIGPIWSGDSAPASLVRLRDALRREATAVGARVIDPIAGRWLAGAAKRYIGNDGLHPTNAGHRHIAALVLRALRPLGARPAATRSAATSAPRSANPSPVAVVTASGSRPVPRCAS
jgi:lysophospholipase L1-like esterase